MIETRPPRMSYWLVPAEPFLSQCQDAVTRFAKRYGGPDFEPHVTIYFGNFHERDNVHAVVEELTSFPKVSLKAQALLFTEQYTKSCYVQFAPSETLSEMCSKAQSVVAAPENYSVNPHMSLFYGQLSQKQQQEILAAFELPSAVEFDVVKAIENPPQVASAEDVHYWREAAQGRLR